MRCFSARSSGAASITKSRVGDAASRRLGNRDALERRAIVTEFIEFRADPVADASTHVGDRIA